MIDFNKFSILSVLCKEAGKMGQEYTRYILDNYDNFLLKIKTERLKELQRTNNNISDLYKKGSSISSLSNKVTIID